MIEVVSVAGLVTVQDGGRPGRMHQGIPPGGALVPERLAAANAAARNAHAESGLEVFGAVTVSARVPVLAAADGEPARLLGAGEAWSVATRGARVRYLAVRGGIDAPPVLGGRGTLLGAGFGGHEGRPLRRGDRLRAGEAPPLDEPAPALPDPASTILVVPGPDLERFAQGALEVLFASRFVVSPRSDRTGVRLTAAQGQPLPRADGDAAVSGPMVRGAIQVPASGEPIALGPDHPTTGGYPVLATVVTRCLGTLMDRAPGAEVRFALAR